MAPSTQADRLTNIEAALDRLFARLDDENNAALQVPGVVNNLASSLHLQIQALSDRMDSLQQQVATTAPVPNSPASAPVQPPVEGTSAPPTSSAREPKVGAPTPFSGEQSKLAAFLAQCNLYIKVQPSMFPTDESKILWMGSWLSGNAFDWFDSLVQNDPNAACITSVDAFIQELRTNFGDPDRMATAERKLDALKQRGSFSEYLTSFRKYQSILDWNDSSLSYQFYRGLKDEIKDEMMKIGRPSKLQERIDLARRIDTRLSERSIEKQGYTHQRASNPAPVYRQSTTTVSSTSTVPSKSSGQFLPAGTLKRGKLSPEERKRRQDKNLCMFCGSANHSIDKCDVKPKDSQVKREPPKN